MIITRITGSTDTQIEAISPIVITTLSTGVVGDRGPQGNPGSPGINGREVELRNSGTAIEWKFVGETYWRLLVPLDTLQGSQGEPGIQGIPGIQGTSGPQGPSGPTGPTGADGRDIELQTSATHLEWRYVEDSIWNPVIALSALVGPQGVKGDKGDTGNVGPQGPAGPTGSLAQIDPPAGFNWDFTARPLKIYKIGRQSHVDLQPESLIDPLCFSGVCYHVDVATGNDANSGTGTYDGDFSSPVKSIWKAVQLGNATSAPYRVIVKSGTYLRANSFSNNNAHTPTQSVYMRAVGGKAVSAMFDDLTWPGATDATYTNTYKVARSSVLRVFDITNIDEHGDFAELLKVSDASTCNTTPGSWAQVGGDLYVRRKDGAAVTNANTRAFLLSNNAAFTTNNIKVYIEGFDFYGGNLGVLRANSAPNSSLVANNCSFKYSGSTSSLVDGCVILDHGYTAFFNCVASKNSKDGFNFHVGAGGSNPHPLLVNCIGRNNGLSPSQSNNGLTLHDGIVGISVGCQWHDNFGANSGHINSGTQLWSVCDKAWNSKGDAVYGGSQQGRDYWMSEGKLWLDTCSSATKGASVYSSANANVYVRDFSGHSLQTDSGGTITTY